MSLQDFDYLYNLCESTMGEYTLAVWGVWDVQATTTFLQSALVANEFCSVLNQGQRVGAISVLEQAHHHQLDQLYIEPERQNAGIGSAVVRRVLDQARSVGKPVKLRVLAPNPAKQLYERLGFSVTESTQERYYMTCC